MKYQMMESQSSLIALLMLSSQVGVFLYMASLIASDPIGYWLKKHLKQYAILLVHTFNLCRGIIFCQAYNEWTTEQKSQ